MRIVLQTIDRADFSGPRRCQRGRLRTTTMTALDPIVLPRPSRPATKRLKQTSAAATINSVISTRLYCNRNRLTAVARPKAVPVNLKPELPSTGNGGRKESATALFRPRPWRPVGWACCRRSVPRLVAGGFFQCSLARRSVFRRGTLHSAAVIDARSSQASNAAHVANLCV